MASAIEEKVKPKMRVGHLVARETLKGTQRGVIVSKSTIEGEVLYIVRSLRDCANFSVWLESDIKRVFGFWRVSKEA